MDNLILNIAALAFTVVSTAVGTTWLLSRTLDQRDVKLTAMITAHELADTERFAMIGAKILEATHQLNTNFGDTGRALREHMHGIELAVEKAKTENLETFIRRDSFFKIIDGVDAHFRRIEDKLDEIAKYRDEELEQGRG